MLTGLITVAPWEGVFAGFFPEIGESGERDDPWTPGSDHELLEVFEEEPCEYDCAPGAPPLCPTPSPFVAEMEAEMASALINGCPAGYGSSKSVACIDLWIAQEIVIGVGFATKGDGRPDDPNANIE